MKISEILKDIEDISIVDNYGSSADGFNGTDVGLEPVEMDDSIYDQDNSNEDGSDSDNVEMVNPLQQTHEILKKDAGIENEVDLIKDSVTDFEFDDQSRTESESQKLADNDLEATKRNSGIPSSTNNAPKKAPRTAPKKAPESNNAEDDSSEEEEDK